MKLGNAPIGARARAFPCYLLFRLKLHITRKAKGILATSKDTINSQTRQRIVSFAKAEKELNRKMLFLD